MKKCQLTKLALFGMASGLIAIGQPGLEAADDNSIDIQYLMAKPKCAAHGCADLVAEREMSEASEDQDMDDTSEAADDEDTDEEENKADNKKNDNKDEKPVQHPAKLNITG